MMISSSSSDRSSSSSDSEEDGPVQSTLRRFPVGGKKAPAHLDTSGKIKNQKKKKKGKANVDENLPGWTPKRRRAIREFPSESIHVCDSHCMYMRVSENKKISLFSSLDIQKYMEERVDFDHPVIITFTGNVQSSGFAVYRGSGTCVECWRATYEHVFVLTEPQWWSKLHLNFKIVKGDTKQYKDWGMLMFFTLKHTKHAASSPAPSPGRAKKVQEIEEELCEHLNRSMSTADEM
jgi:hypothetical protein